MLLDAIALLRADGSAKAPSAEASSTTPKPAQDTADGAKFRANAIEADVLHDLTDQDLEKLGVLLGHRRRLLRAIAELDGAPAVAITESSAPWALSRRFGMRVGAVSERYTLARSQTGEAGR